MTQSEKEREIRKFDFSLENTDPLWFPLVGTKTNERFKWEYRERTGLGNSGHGETNGAKKGRANKVGARMTLQAWGIYFGGGGIPTDSIPSKKSLRRR